MVLTRTTLSTIALIGLVATTAGAQRGLIGRGPLTPGGQRGAGPRPLLFGFALECTKCGSVGRGGRVGGGRGEAPFASWHYDEYPRIAAVVGGSAAERAGVRQGDILMSVDGLSILTDEGSERFAELRAGDSVHLTLDRSGKTMDVELVLNRGGRGGRGRGAIDEPVMAAPMYTTQAQGTRVEIWSDSRVVESTDSTGATILRIGNTVVRLANASQPGLGRGNRGGRRGGAPPLD